MATVKTLISILYLLLYSSLCKADISPDEVSRVESGVTLSQEFLKGLDEVGKGLSKSKTATDAIPKLLKVFDAFGKIAASFGFIGALISFIFAFIPQEDPMLNFLKEQFAEVNRKLDSISIQISTLQTEMEWTDYASTYSKDENAIRNSWAKLKEFIENAPLASTQEQKTRLAERFTNFYENTATESSIANLYTYITENNPVSLNKNLLKLVIEKSNGDFNALVQYSTYYTSLMVSGLKLNVFYYILKGYDAESKADEAAAQLSDTLAAIKDALIECVDDFEKWVQMDVVKFTTERLSNTKKLASDIQDHLERKFHWYKWIVITHSKDAENEFTFGKSISVPVQEKTVVHVIHQVKGSSVEQRIMDEVKKSIQIELSKLPPYECVNMKEELLHRFGSKVINYINFLHVVTKPSDYEQTVNSDIMLRCPLFLNRDYNIFLKRKDTVGTPTCSNDTCINGECKTIKDTTQGFCKCNKMFHGPACDENIQNIIDYAAIESVINGVIYQPVPDLTAIYFSVNELKAYTKEIIESVLNDIHWTQVFVKYSSTIQKFRYINSLHSRLQNRTINQRHYIYEIGAQFAAGGHTFMFYLTDFNHMMMGTGFGDNRNILDIFRKSLNQESSDPIGCTKDYTEKLDYFVRFMFALEKEAVLAWSKYLLITGKSENIGFAEKTFQEGVSDQWRLYNKNGCGHLQAANLQNSYCEKPYHSTHQQQVKLRCHGQYKPFPETVLCSLGQWSALPVCYAEPVKGRVVCNTENGATVCKTSCLPGWGFSPSSLSSNYRCSKLPCPSFTPPPCDHCTSNSVCKDHEVT
ncbi:uncharacterized protein LOC130567632 [Triplophysa rosa]|uniref:uncharacterized protein LOC130567632 n=1 Tax=Triplophysa rosa TaxID=992332 RepID=UPI002545E2B6|nr:uncharacterized protein LOC130567632 [Triplophysa rosa]